MYIWFKFTNGSGVCVVDEPCIDDAKKHLTEQERLMIAKAGTLPYPASPIRNPNSNGCPPFCYTPNECLNHGCCHKSYACSE